MSATLNEIAEQRHVLTPGRYVGAEEAEGDGEPLEQKIARLKAALVEAFAESDRLQSQVREALGRIDA